MTFTEARGYISRFCRPRVGGIKNFNPPEDIETLARLIRIVFKIVLWAEPTTWGRRLRIKAGGFYTDYPEYIIALLEFLLYEQFRTMLPQSRPSLDMSPDEYIVRGLSGQKVDELIPMYRIPPSLA